MASNIKGITVEIGGDTGPLDKALKEVNTTSRNLQSELRKVGKSLKFDPSSTEMLSQKQKILSESIENTKNKLEILKQAEAQVKEQFNNGELGEEKYRAFEREIENTENKLKNLEKQFNVSSPSLQAFGQKAGEVGEKLKSAGEKMESVGTGIATKVTAPIAAGFGVADKAAMDFDHQMADIQKEVAAKGENVSSVMNKMSSSSLKWSQDFGQSTDSINQGLLTLVKDGYSGSEAMSIMQTSLYTARGANEDLATVVDQLGSSLEAYGMKTNNAAQTTQNAAHMADTFAYISNHTKASITSLGEAFSVVGATANSLHQPMAETAAAIGELESNGIDATTAATSLQAGLVNLTKPTKKMKAALDEMKFSAFDSKGNMKDLATILTEMQGKMSGWTNQQKQAAIATIFGKESLASWNVLMHKGGSYLADLSSKANNATGEVKKLSDSMKNTDANKFKKFQETAHAMAVSIGQEVLPVFTPLIEKITAIIKSFSSLDAGTKKSIVTFGLVAAVIGPIILIIGTLVEKIGSIAKGVGGAIAVFGKLKTAINAAGGVFTLLTSPIGIALLAIAGIATVAILVIKNWTPIKAFFMNLWIGVKQKFSEFWNWLKPFMAQWGPVILTVIAPFIGIPLLIAQHWDGIKTTLANIWNSIKATASSIFNGIASFFGSIWSSILNTFTSVITSIVSFVATNFSGVFAGIQTIFTGIQTFFTGIWEAIKATFLGAVLIIMDLVTGNFTKLSQDAKLIWTDLQKAFSDIWNGIKEVFSGALQAIEAYYTTIFNAMVSFAVGLWNGFTSFLSNLWTSITSTATNAWNSLKSVVTSIITAIVSTAQNIWNGLLNWFAALPGRLYNLGVNIFDSMKNGVSSALSTLGSVVQDGFNSAISFITNLPSEAVEWGSDFIDGLINGITSKVGAVGNAVSSVASTIRSYLHFSVPDKGPLTDYESWMPDFMEGLAKGIDGSLNVLDNSLLKVSDTLANAVMPERSARDQLWIDMSKGVETYDSAIQKLSHANDMLAISTGNSETDLRNMLGQMTNISTMSVAAYNQYHKLGNSIGWANEKTQAALKSYQDYQKAYAETAQKVVDAEQKIRDNQYSDALEKIDAKVKSLTADSDDLYKKLDGQQQALEELQFKAAGLDSEYEELVKTYGEFSDEAKNAAKAIDENNQAMQDLGKNIEETKEKMEDASVSDLNSLFDKLKSALKDYYDDEEKEEEASWQQKIDSNSKWKEDTLDSLESVYNAKKSEIEKEKTLLDRSDSDEDDNDKIAADKKILDMNYSAKAKADAQADLNSILKEQNRRHQKESLDDQESALETQYNNNKDNIEKAAKANEDYYSSQIDNIKSFYEDKEKAANLDAEAQQMIVQNNQTEIVKLLKSYGEDYEIAGASLGERLVKGFKDKMFSIGEILDGVTLQANDIVNKIASTPSVAVNAAYSGGYSNGNYSSGRDYMQQTTVHNSYGALLHADKIVLNNSKDVQQTAEELAFYTQQALRSKGGK